MGVSTKRTGTLLPMSALVSNTVRNGSFAAGDLFVDWLAASKQTAWQLLPLHETELQKGSKNIHVPSPYKGYGIGLDPRFLSAESPVPTDAELTTFVKKNSYWLTNYVLFCALRDRFGTDNWTKWPKEIRLRETEAIEKWQKILTSEINFYTMTQARLHLEYEQLKARALANNILLIGDMPFYLGLCSPLVWQYQHVFEIEKDGSLLKVSGVLKGIKSHFGRQIWGHPLYKWKDTDNSKDLCKVFEIRVRYLAWLFDWVRFDHAKGLFSYGVLNLSDHKLDCYECGPGRPFLEKIIKYAQYRHLKIYAEDTGDQLKDLRNCLHAHHLPGVKIFRFAYNEKRKSYSDQYLKISRYPINTVAYTTTHDTETLLGYLEKLSVYEIDLLKKKLRIKETINIQKLARIIREKIIKSPAKIVIIPLQDWLLTTERINIPGTEKDRNDKNWKFKMLVPIENLPTDL